MEQFKFMYNMCCQHLVDILVFRGLYILYLINDLALSYDVAALNIRSYFWKPYLIPTDSWKSLFLMYLFYIFVDKLIFLDVAKRVLISLLRPNKEPRGLCKYIQRANIGIRKYSAKNNGFN